MCGWLKKLAHSASVKVCIRAPSMSRRSISPRSSGLFRPIPITPSLPPGYISGGPLLRGQVTRTGEHPQALPDPRRRLPSWPDHAPSDRRRDTTGVSGPALRRPRRPHPAERLPNLPADRRRRRSDRRHRRQPPARPSRLNDDFINGLIGSLGRSACGPRSPHCTCGVSSGVMYYYASYLRSCLI